MVVMPSLLSFGLHIQLHQRASALSSKSKEAIFFITNLLSFEHQLKNKVVFLFDNRKTSPLCLVIIHQQNTFVHRKTIYYILRGKKYLFFDGLRLLRRCFYSVRDQCHMYMCSDPSEAMFLKNRVSLQTVPRVRSRATYTIPRSFHSVYVPALRSMVVLLSYLRTLMLDAH